MRSGYYGIYKQKEYRIVVRRDGNLEVVTKDPKSVELGFEQDEDVYFKIICKEELEDIYKINSKAVYKGTTFGILVDSEDRDIFVLSGDEECAEKFPMEYHDRREFTMEVPRKDVEVVERRRTVNIEDL